MLRGSFAARTIMALAPCAAVIATTKWAIRDAPVWTRKPVATFTDQALVDRNSSQPQCIADHADRGERHGGRHL